MNATDDQGRLLIPFTIGDTVDVSIERTPHLNVSGVIVGITIDGCPIIHLQRSYDIEYVYQGEQPYAFGYPPEHEEFLQRISTRSGFKIGRGEEVPSGQGPILLWHDAHKSFCEQTNTRALRRRVILHCPETRFHLDSSLVDCFLMIVGLNEEQTLKGIREYYKKRASQGIGNDLMIPTP